MNSPSRGIQNAASWSRDAQTRHFSPGTSFLWGILLALSGCGPAAVEAPDVDPKAAATQAMALLDKDSDGHLSEAEARESPPIFLAREKYDASHDKRISREEIETRLNDIYSQGIGITQRECTVMLDKRPLAGAVVRFVPESFLGSEVSAAQGTSNNSGVAVMAVPEDRLPADLKGISGIHAGLYRVEITHPTQPIPEKFNTKTTLGFDTHFDSRNDPLVFMLKSR
jgi:hypothetical protein